MQRRRVAITGTGVVAPNGVGLEAFWDAVMEGRSGLRPIERFDVSEYRSRIGGEVRDWTPVDFMQREHAKTSGLFAQFAIASSRMAWEASGLEKAGLEKNRIGVCSGSTIGAPNEVYSEQMKRFLKRGPRGVAFFASAEYTPHAATARVALELGISGPNHTVSTGCSTGLDVVGWGLGMIQSGHLDAAVVSAADSVLSPLEFATLDVMGILSTKNDTPEKAVRPYDRDRDGSVASEGGGALVLEDMEKARARGAPILAEVLGHGCSNELNHLVSDQIHPGAIIQALEEALNESLVSAEDIDYVCAHGVGMLHYDRSETLAFKEAFGERAYRIPVSSVKGLTGQAYAGGAMFQLATVVKVFETRMIPPTYNHERPDPECDLDYVAEGPRRNDVEVCLMNSQSVGGTHSVLVLGKGDQ
jgi:3-oxoacyl-[acyl-carrier-protein] synthase II